MRLAADVGGWAAVELGLGQQLAEEPANAVVVVAVGELAELAQGVFHRRRGVGVELTDRLAAARRPAQTTLNSFFG